MEPCDTQQQWVAGRYPPHDMYGCPNKLGGLTWRRTMTADPKTANLCSTGECRACSCMQVATGALPHYQPRLDCVQNSAARAPSVAAVPLCSDLSNLVLRDIPNRYCVYCRGNQRKTCAVGRYGNYPEQCQAPDENVSRAAPRNGCFGRPSTGCRPASRPPHTFCATCAGQDAHRAALRRLVEGSLRPGQHR